MNQTYKNLEIILIDDNSTDHCGEMCDSFAKEDSRVRVAHVKAGSAGAARNVGLDMATGEYIAFVDSDDWIDLNMYEAMVGSIRESNSKIVKCEIEFVFADHSEMCYSGGEKQSIFSDEAIAGLFICIRKDKCDSNTILSGFMVDKLFASEIWEKLRFDESYRNSEDRKAYFEIFRRIEAIELCHKTVYHYRRFVGISRSAKLCNEDNYRFIYPVYFWAKGNEKFELLIAENVICHTLGRVRASAYLNEYDKFLDTYSAYKQNWHDLKKALPGSRNIFIILSYSLRFFPHILWCGLRALNCIGKI